LKDGSATITNELKAEGSGRKQLVFKDLGAQLSWRLVYMIEYIGPVFLFPLFYFCDELIYG
jgi:hypothetical protein